MKKVYFVRHGESEFNAGGKIKENDGSEVLLTELGHQQAKFIAARAKKLGIEKIVSSTLERAKQTAEHISQATGVPVETSNLFVERKYPTGRVGLTLEHPEVQEVERLMIEKFGDETYQHSDEELFPAIKDRGVRALEYLENQPENTILVVTHGIFLRVLISVAIFGKNLSGEEAAKIVKSFKTKNTGLTLLEYGPEDRNTYVPWSVRTWNDHAHLG